MVTKKFEFTPVPVDLYPGSGEYEIQYVSAVGSFQRTIANKLDIQLQVVTDIYPGSSSYDRLKDSYDAEIRKLNVELEKLGCPRFEPSYD